MKSLHQLLDDAAGEFPDRVSVEEPGGEPVTYAAMAELSDRVRDRLVALGVAPGDRVGMCLTKSADAVATIFGVMKAGAAYVPVDPTAPAVRSTMIFEDCAVRVLVVEEGRAGDFRAAFADAGFAAELLVVAETGAGGPLRQLLDQLDGEAPCPAVATVERGDSDLAYILYTSGSTGRPKGVMLSHGNAASFVDWCSEVLDPRPEDRFSSHAPFHFDLSILDVYVSQKHGAALVIVDEHLGKEPARLAPWISEKGITVWYSTPSILALMAEFGDLDQRDYTALRVVNFAGEVFPIKHLRILQSLWPAPRYLNLYGPTETNVCTYYEIEGAIDPARTTPVPIGQACSHCRALVVDEHGGPVGRGEEGELCIAGPSVMQGYWNLPENTAKAFLEHGGDRYYRTGDVVTELEGGGFDFVGRRDRMIKKRGYRIELGEIESALYRHPQVREAAVVATDDGTGVKVKAYLSSADGGNLSVIGLKSHCSKHLPLYMVPDVFSRLESLPKTSTDKIDYQSLVRLG